MPDITLPNGQIASFPEGTPQEEMLRVIQQHIGAQPTGPGTPGYVGSVLPVSVDEQGNPRLDWNAGLIGSLVRAFSAPGDVYTGKLPITNPNITTDAPGGIYNPAMLGRAAEMAAVISPPNPAIRAGDLPIPGAARATMAPSPVPPPSAMQLKNTANAQYDAARAAGLDISGKAVANMAQGIRSGLTSGPGIIEKTAPKTFAILDELATPPKDGFVTIPGLEAARRGLSNIKIEGGTEGLAAGYAVRGIDDFMASLGDSAIAPSSAATNAAAVADILRTARANYAAAQRSNDITGALDRANTGITDRAAARAAAANSGTNIDNALRQRVASLLQNPENIAGYSQAEIDALKGFVQGSAARNAARNIANFFGGGRGLLGALETAIGAGAGAMHSPMGAAIGGITPLAVGGAAKSVQNRMALNAINAIDEMIRSRSPAYESILAVQPLVRPGLDRDALLLRMLGIGATQSVPAAQTSR